ncbi:hypothetical protein BN2497_11265 [Janthinobacterium sp. CG23_2]|nr:hypothetical protein BN2497_11265 [Janthinobacterium sp. CG23_2]CUU32030.1 hypothetical protein BN3177_11265 [Janthinobacterium sp. CG23_2]
MEIYFNISQIAYFYPVYPTIYAEAGTKAEYIHQETEKIFQKCQFQDTEKAVSCNKVYIATFPH